MSQNSSVDIPDSESLEIVQNYLKQINSENTANDESKNIMNNILTFISENNNNFGNSDNNSSENSEDEDNLNSLSMDEVTDLKEKIELQNKLQDKINESIQKEKELLKITQEKLICEVKLLETIKQRLFEEEKLKLLLDSSTLSNEVNISTQPEHTQTTNEVYKVVNTNIESKTKVTKLNSSILKMYKR